MYHVIQQCARSLALVLFLGAGLAFTSTPAAGQVDVSPGLRVGVNAATAGGDAEDVGSIFTGLAAPNAPQSGTVSSRDGIMIGAFATVDFGAPVSLQPSLRWIQKGYSIEHANFFNIPVTTTVKFSYIEIPVLARFDVPFKISGFAPYLFAGPTLGFNLGAESEYGVENDLPGNPFADTQDLKDVNGDSAIGGTDFGLEFGAGASYSVRGLGTASADIRYGLGLANVLETDNFSQDYSLTNQVLSITLGFSL